MELKKIAQLATERTPETQPWPNYFRLRGKELEVLFSQYNVEDAKRVLEIGCGNAFYSATFSSRSEEVVAADLLNLDATTHSIGIENARKLLNSLGVKNCRLCVCSAEKIPFKKESFDVVFSAYVLEHIRQRKYVLEEVGRVLTKGGISICVVPNFIGSLLYPSAFYVYLLRRIFFHLTRRYFKSTKEGLEIEKKTLGERNVKKKITFREFRKTYPHFPIPEPHGEYKNYFEEIISYLPKRWIELFNSSGLRVINTFSNMVIPWNLLCTFHAESPLYIYERSTKLNKTLGRIAPFKWLGNNFCIVAKKEE